MRMLILCCGLFFCAQLWAEKLPDWLQQVAAEKYRQPEQMLQLLMQNHQQQTLLPLEQQVIFFREQSAVLRALGRHQEQYIAAEQGLALLQQDSAIKAELLFHLGFATEMQGNYAAAMELYQQGTELAERFKQPQLIIKGYINQAAIFSARGEAARALELLRDAYSRAGLLQDQEISAEINAELGLLYASLDYEQDAVPLLELALKLYQQLGWHKNTMAVLYNLARTYSMLEQHEAALQAYHQMLQYSQRHQDTANLYHAYLGLAITSNQIGRIETALNYIEKAEVYLPQLQSAVFNSSHYYEKAVIYQKLALSAQALQQLLLAEQFLQQDESGDNSSKLALLYLKAELLAEQGQYERAYQTMLTFSGLLRQGRAQEVRLEQMKQQFDAELQQQLGLRLQQQSESSALQLAASNRQIIWLWSALSMAVAAVLLLLLLLWRTHRRTAPALLNLPTEHNG